MCLAPKSVDWQLEYINIYMYRQVARVPKLIQEVQRREQMEKNLL